MLPWLRFVIAFFVFCHGFVYVRIGSVLPAPVQGWKGTSWLFGDALAGSRLNAAIVGLHVVAGVATLACAFAIAFAPSVPVVAPSGNHGRTGRSRSVCALLGRADDASLRGGPLGALLSAGLLLTAILFPAAFH